MKFAAASAFALGVLAWSTAGAYQYTGKKTQVSVGRSCVSSGYSFTPAAGEGVAIHVYGMVSVDPLFPTAVVTLTNGHTPASSVTQFPVKTISLLLQGQSSSSRMLSATVRRTFAKPGGGTAQIDYSIADRLSANGNSQTLYQRQSGALASFYPVDLWYYVFNNTTWLETQQGNSALGVAFDAMTLFGYADDTPSFSINVLNGCGSITSSTQRQARVEVFKVAYSDFQPTLDAEWAKADGQIFVNGAPVLTHDHTPFINNGRRRLAAATL